MSAQDSSGVFWDSLADLLAVELEADLVLLLSDVEGLYTGPPSEPDSKIIHTYIEEFHRDKITFGDESQLDRRGMAAKVKAAVCVASAGIPVIISRLLSFSPPLLFLCFSVCTMSSP